MNDLRELWNEFIAWFQGHKAVGYIGLLLTSVTFLLSFCAVTTLGGIIQALAGDRLKEMREFFERPTQANWWAAVIIYALAIISSSAVIIIFAKDVVRDKRILNAERQNLITELGNAQEEITDYSIGLNQMKHLILSHSTLLTLLAPVRPGKETLADEKDEMGDIVEAFLLQAVGVFGRPVGRASVLRPIQKGDTTYLEFWRHIGMPAESLIPKRFPVGDSNKEGVAGCAFKQGTFERAILYNDKGLWECDHPCYKHRRPKTEEPGYKSFVAIPLLDPDERCLGVLCFDSKDADTFDSETIVKTLQQIANGLSAALAVYNNLASVGLRERSDEDV